MKLTKILVTLLLLAALPATASQPVFGAQVQLRHYATHDDRVDIQINNLTGQQLYWAGPGPNNGQVNTWTNAVNGFAPNGYQATLTTSQPSSLTTLQWLHTNTDSPLWAQNFNVWCGTNCPNTYGGSGWYNFWLITYPYSQNELRTDLEFAFELLECIVNFTLIVCGDEVAWEELQMNVVNAVNEENELPNEPNIGWCGIVYADNTLSTPVSQLAYPILGDLNDTKDHVAVLINMMYVAQVVTVNQASNMTGNSQFIVNLYKYQDWYDYGGPEVGPPLQLLPTQPPPTGVPFPALKALAR